MAWTKGTIEGVWLYHPTVWRDERGYFMESFTAAKLPETLRDIIFVQDNEAQSEKGVLRGLHYQLPPYAQSKLVRCIQGKILDVIVDIRPGSSAYGRHMAVVLDGEDKNQLFVPQGFAHGYVVLSDTAIVAYKCDNHYHPEVEGSLLYNDPGLGINWMIPENQLIVSEKDRKSPTLVNHIPFR